MAPEDLLAIVAAALDDVGAPYMLTGSLACIYFGEPRLTVDIDLVVELDEDRIDALAAHFASDDYYFDAAMAKDSLAAGTQFNLIHIPSGMKVDLVFRRARAFSATEFGRRRTRRLRSGAEISVACPEDLILAKLEFYRDGGSDKHLRDIAGILRVSGDQLDRSYIERWADQLGVADIWRDLAAGIF